MLPPWVKQTALALVSAKAGSAAGGARGGQGHGASGHPGTALAGVDVFGYAKKAWPSVKRAAFRFRQQIAPLVLLGIGAIAGVVISGEGIGSGLVLSLVVAGLTAFWLREPLTRRPKVRIDAGICMGLAAVWLWATAMFGFAVMDWVGVVLWVLPAGVWWFRHGARRPVQSPSPSGSPSPEEDAAPIELHEGVTLPKAGELTLDQQRWNANIRDNARRSPLRGIEMSGPVPFEHGFSYSLHLVPGEQHLGEVRAQLPFIASGLERMMEDLVLEQHPDYSTPNILRLQIVTKSPIKETVWFRHPAVENGRIRLGLFADGFGYATYRLYDPNSMWGGFILGSSGSGKSREMELIALSARWLGNTVLIYLDGQNGASSPLLYQHAMWSGGPPEAESMLSAIERGMTIRQKYNRAYKIHGFNPTPKRPGVFIIVDECHKIFHSGNGERWGYVAREGRKLGFAILAASQYSGLAGTFGGADPLRSNLLEGNGLVKRTSSKVSVNMIDIPGLGLSPGKLPKLPGYGLLIASGDDERSAPYRCDYIPDEDDRLINPELPVPTVGEWFERSAADGWEPDLDPMTARAFGADFVNRHEIAARRDAALRAEIENESLDLWEPPVLDGELLDSWDGEQPSLGDGGSAQRTLADQVMALPWSDYEGADPDLSGKVMQRQQIVAALPEGTNMSTLASALRTLCDQKRLESVGQRGYGKYRLNE